MTRFIPISFHLLYMIVDHSLMQVYLKEVKIENNIPDVGHRVCFFVIIIILHMDGGHMYGTRTRHLFKKLTELQGPPGHEYLVRECMKEELEKYADEVIQDNLGGVFGVRKGNGPKVMVAGHMDEVGVMVTHITQNGMIRFQTLGGWWNQVLLAQRVQIMTDNGPVPGVIGSIPPHNLSHEQRKKPMETKDML